MSNSNKNRSLCRFRKAAMLILPLGLALSGLGQHAQAQPQASAPSCSAALADLMAEWNRVGYQEPSKPSQMVVSGRNGQTTTAGRYYFLRAEIQASARSCEASRQEEAMQHINTVRVALAGRGTMVQSGS
ncbi:MAG: hypothetical protein ABSE20_02330 [Acetobacteraceae bacterium]